MRPREDPVLSMRDGPLDPTTTKPWVPHFLTTLSSLKQEIVAKIPLNPTMTTFSPDFLRNTFGGSEHSPGFNFIPPSPGPCILRNRSYFTIDGRYDPYIPVQPGLHGAKLVPFFNENPEAVHVLPVNFDSTSDNVPLFVMHVDAKGRWRYTYYGHYSQTRWSDKLDDDRMVQCIPTELREYWAKELSSAGRPEWVSNALMNHFFPKPEYAGRMFGKSVDEGGSVMSADMDQREEKVRKDVVKYLGELRDWEKDARMKTAMISKDFILHAFERVSEMNWNNDGRMLMLDRLMRMILRRSVCGGSTSSVSTGRRTSTTCSARCRREIQRTSATRCGSDGTRERTGSAMRGPA
jgi:hypothetical protein